MSITLAGYSFEGPYSQESSLRNAAGVYAILDERADSYYVLDVGESGEVKDRVESHDRRQCWKRYAQGPIRYAVHYTPSVSAAGRREIERAVRRKYSPPCGDV
jgi:hypothetical protein